MKKIYKSIIYVFISANFLAAPTLLAVGCDSVYGGGCNHITSKSSTENMLTLISYLIGIGFGIRSAFLFRDANHEYYDQSKTKI